MLLENQFKNPALIMLKTLAMNLIFQRAHLRVIMGQTKIWMIVMKIKMSRVFRDIFIVMDSRKMETKKAQTIRSKLNLKILKLFCYICELKILG